MEYKYTLADLKTMQKWSFQHKIGVAQCRIIEWYERFDGNVAVNFSGGKDSTVLLDLCRRIYPDIPAVFCDTGLEFPEVLEFVKSQKSVETTQPQFCKICTNCEEKCFGKIVKIYGWNFPNKDTAKTIKYAKRGANWAINAMNGVRSDGVTPSEFRENTFKRWRFLIDCGYKISDECCKILKEKPLDKWHKKTANKPIIGTMASESRRRREAWQFTGCNAFDTKKPVSKPISFFTEQDILRYLKEFEIPFASVYGEIIFDEKTQKFRTTGEERTGCCLCPTGCHLDKISKFQRLKNTHFEMWDYGINRLGLGEFLEFVGVEYK